MRNANGNGIPNFIKIALPKLLMRKPIQEFSDICSFSKLFRQLSQFRRPHADERFRSDSGDQPALKIPVFRILQLKKRSSDLICYHDPLPAVSFFCPDPPVCQQRNFNMGDYTDFPVCSQCIFSVFQGCFTKDVARQRIVACERRFGHFIGQKSVQDKKAQGSPLVSAGIFENLKQLYPREVIS